MQLVAVLANKAFPSATVVLRENLTLRMIALSKVPSKMPREPANHTSGSWLLLVRVNPTHHLHKPLLPNNNTQHQDLPLPLTNQLLSKLINQLLSKLINQLQPINQLQSQPQPQLQLQPMSLLQSQPPRVPSLNSNSLELVLLTRLRLSLNKLLSSSCSLLFQADTLLMSQLYLMEPS